MTASAPRDRGSSGHTEGPDRTCATPSHSPDDVSEMDEQTPREPYDGPAEPAKSPASGRPAPPEQARRPESAPEREREPEPPTHPGAAAGEAAPSETAPDTSSGAASDPEPEAPPTSRQDHLPPVGNIAPKGGDGELNGLSPDEAALRSLMHEAVDGLRASPEALDHLRRAVPLRRQRRRQAMLGAAAAALLVGLAMPAVIRAAAPSGRTTASPAGVGTPYAASPGPIAPRTGSAADPTVLVTTPPESGSDAYGQVTPTSTPSATRTSRKPVPDCSSVQLGRGVSETGSPDADGRVYGWFRVANVSDTPCTVPSGGFVQAVAHGAAQPGSIQVVGHTQGDPASNLPTDSSNAPIVLNPGQDYEVAFAWVPADTKSGGCTTATSPPVSSTPAPTVTDTAGTDQSGGTDAGSSGDGDQATGDGSPTVSEPSVTLNHTPAAGAPVVSGPVIQGACAGTVYTTPPMPDSAATPAP